MASSGEKLRWHIIDDGQHLKHTKDGWVHSEEPTGNIAMVIHPSYVTNSGSIRNGQDDKVKELCAVCRLDSGRNEFGMFNRDGFCQACGARRDGNGPRLIDYDGFIAKLEDTTFNDTDEFVAESGVRTSVNGKDGLPRKAYLRDAVLGNAKVFEGTHYTKIEYREIKEDNWEEMNLTRPEGVEGKIKYLKLIEFNTEKSPLSIDEIQKLIDCPNIIVIAE